MLSKSTKNAVKGYNPWINYLTIPSFIIFALLLHENLLLFFTLVLPIAVLVFAILSIVNTYYDVENGIFYKWDYGGKMSGKYINNFDDSIKALCRTDQIKSISMIKHFGQIVGLRIMINEYDQDSIKVYTKAYQSLISKLRMS